MILVELHGGRLHVRSLFVRWQHSLVVRQQPPLQAPHERRVLQHRLQDARGLQGFTFLYCNLDHQLFNRCLDVTKCLPCPNPWLSRIPMTSMAGGCRNLLVVSHHSDRSCHFRIQLVECLASTWFGWNGSEAPELLRNIRMIPRLGRHSVRYCEFQILPWINHPYSQIH